MVTIDNLTPENVLAAMKSSLYRVFEGELNLNLIGIRSLKPRDNTFSDVLCVLYQSWHNDITQPQWQLETFQVTTDIGSFHRQTLFENTERTLLVPGQYFSLWTFGYHGEQQPALVQNAPATVLRDEDSPMEIDEEDYMDMLTTKVLQTGFFGIHCHEANVSANKCIANTWSECGQVVAEKNDFERLLYLCQQSSQRWGKTFTYTLLEQDDLIVFKD